MLTRIPPLTTFSITFTYPLLLPALCTIVGLEGVPPKGLLARAVANASSRAPLALFPELQLGTPSFLWKEHTAFGSPEARFQLRTLGFSSYCNIRRGEKWEWCKYTMRVYLRLEYAVSSAEPDQAQ